MKTFAARGNSYSLNLNGYGYFLGIAAPTLDSPTTLLKLDTVLYVKPPTEQLDISTIQTLGNIFKTISDIIDTPIGLVNGSNAQFITHYGFIPDTLRCYINGLLQSNNYTTQGTTIIQFDESPLTGDEIVFIYSKVNL